MEHPTRCITGPAARRFRPLAVGLAAVLLTLATCPFAPVSAEDARGLPPDRVSAAVARIDGIVAEVMAATKVPGIAVAVVHDGAVIHARGYGVREVGTDRPVGADTAFQIASVSKSLAATVVARQVGEGVVAWDTPVRTHLPWFALADPWVSEHVTIGDLFAHRSGLPDHAGDHLEDLGYDRRVILERLRLLPLAPFRDSYAYTNFGLTAAAEAVAVASGLEWAELSQTALYEPLGMASTSSRFADWRAEDDRAVGHVLVDGVFAPVSVRMPDEQAPAGGVSSTVRDLARWMIMVMDGGVFEGRRIVDGDALRAAVTPQSVSAPAGAIGSLPGFYGFGFGVRADGPDVVLSHSGAFILGAGSTYSMVPSARLGIVALSNATAVGAVETISAEFMDLALRGEVSREWADVFGPAFGQLIAPVGERAGTQPPADPAPARPLEDYVGEYDSGYFGPATVSRSGDGLVLGLGPAGLAFPLSHWSGDTFVFEMFNENAPPGSLSGAIFSADGAGAVTALEVEVLNELGQGRFERRAE